MRFKKSLAITILFFYTFLNLAPVVQAFVVHDPVHNATSIASKILHGISIGLDKLTTFSLGLPGSGAARGAVIQTADNVCEVTKKGLDAFDSADTFGSIEVLAGSPGELAKLTSKIAVLNAIKNCKQALLKAASAPQPDTQQINVAIGDKAKLAIEIASLETRIENLKEKRTEVSKEIWKGVAIRILLTAQSKLTTRLVNNLIQKYKIGDVLDYVDAASTFIYTKDYIQKNFKDEQSKMIVRSILTNDAFANKVLPAVRAQATRALDFVPEELDISRPDYFLKLAQAGTGQADPYFLQTVFNGQAQQAKSAGDEAAKKEVETGEGFVPVRNCQGAITQQADFDKRNVQYSYEVYQYEEALAKARAQRAADPESVDPEAVPKLQKALDDSRKKLMALPETNRAIVSFCDKIQNPGASVAKSINSYLSANLGSASSLKPENLPFFANFVEGIANNFVGSIIEGQKPGLNILTDAGFRAANIATQQYIDSASPTAKLKEVEQKANQDTMVFTVERNGDTGTSYTFRWSAAAVTGIALMQITGPGGYKKNVTTVEGSYTEVLRVPGIYSFIAYDRASQILGGRTYLVNFEASLAPINVPTGQDLNSLNNTTNNLVNQIKPPDPTPEEVYNNCIASGNTPADCNTQTASNGSGSICQGQYPNVAACTLDYSASYCNQLCGTGIVNGAFISKPSEPIRGWKEQIEAYIKPRG